MNRSSRIVSVALLLLFLPALLQPQRSVSRSFVIKTTAFTEGGPIPQKYTCDGPDDSPNLTWAGVPSGTQSLVLIADDPDAPSGTWTHWLIWNIPSDRALPEDVPKSETLTDGTRQGKNDFRRIGYNG